MSKPWQPYALHILDSIAKIRRIQERGDIRQDDILYDAALRNLQTLSEATQQLPTELKQQCSDIPWREISGFRNILVHNYLGDIDAQTVAAVIEQYLQPLENAVKKMLS
ncbi:MAG TPA: HepT-like ribonuclease domain-containing protein [Cellvibrio sp.]